MKTISVVVPVYCNSETLRALMDELEKASRTLKGYAVEFVFVDDGSTDDSYEMLRQMSSDNRVRVVKLSRNFGSNAAIHAGLTHAVGEAVVIISADLQDPPEMIPDLVREWEKGFQVVLAARTNRVDGFLTRFFAAIFNRLFKKFVFKDFPRGGFDFALVDKKVRTILVDLREKNSYIFGQVLWIGFKRTVLHYERGARRGGRSHWTFVKKIKYLIDAFTAFSYLPIRLMAGLGFLIAGLGILYAITIVTLAVFFDYRIPTGWASLVIIVLTTSGTQLILMGVLGEYLWRVLDESRHRPLYVVESVVEKNRVVG